MINQTDQLADILAEAQKTGEHELPSKLLRTMREADVGIVALSGQVDIEPFFAALVIDFGYFPTTILGQSSLAPEQRARWAALFRWIFAELKGWTAEADVLGQKLGAILIIAGAMGNGSQIWASMPEEVAQNASLLGFLKKIVRSISVQFSSRDGRSAPIWERDAVEKFEADDKAGKWAEVGGSLQLFQHQLFHFGIAFNQSVWLLSKCGLDHLVDATSNIRQTLVALQLASVLGRQKALSLAHASENTYVQFACVYWATSTQGRNQRLTDEEHRNLSAILSRVAVEQDRWTEWMKVFNTYPIRYPLLQESLGRALATADEPAIQAYVESVQLHPWPIGRQYGHGRCVVADCLRVFRAIAPQTQRQILWLLAYERWNAWNFAASYADQHLFTIHWSDLDFAIVAFASECLDENECRRRLDEVRSRLQDLDLQWHDSVSDIWTAWYRLCSRFQPFAHAIEINESGADWLCENKSYLPFDPSANLYIKAKFGIT